MYKIVNKAVYFKVYSNDMVYLGYKAYFMLLLLKVNLILNKSVKKFRMVD